MADREKLRESRKYKNMNISRTKRAFKMKQKAFFVTLNGLSVKQITQFFLKFESPTLRAIIWWKNEKDWTQAVKLFINQSIVQ